MTTGSAYARLGTAACAESAGSVAAIANCASRYHDERFQLRDKYTGMVLACVAYRIEGPDQVVEGHTDSEGRTRRVDTGHRPEMLRVSLIEESASVLGGSQGWSGCV